MSPLKEVKELTHAVRRQQRALEQRLEACLEELRRLCLREAVRAPLTHPLLGLLILGDWGRGKGESWQSDGGWGGHGAWHPERRYSRGG